MATGNLNVARAGHTATLLSRRKGSGCRWRRSGGGAQSCMTRLPAPGLAPAMRHACRSGSHRDSAVQRQGPGCRPACAELYDPATGTWMQDRQHERLADRAHGKSIGGRQGSRRGRNRPIGTRSPPAPRSTTRQPACGHSPAQLAQAARSGHHVDSASRRQSPRRRGIHRRRRLGDLVPHFPARKFSILARGRGRTLARLPFAGDAHTATLLPSGKVLIAGARTIGLVKASEIFDPATGTSSATGDLNFPRLCAVATSLSNGDVLRHGEA